MEGLKDQNSSALVSKNSYHFEDINFENKTRLEIFKGIIPRTKGEKTMR